MSQKLSSVENRAKYFSEPDPLDSRALWWRLRKELALNPDFPMTVDTRRRPAWRVVVNGSFMRGGR
jgi:hypothetical protein